MPHVLHPMPGFYCGHKIYLDSPTIAVPLLSH